MRQIRLITTLLIAILFGTKGIAQEVATNTKEVSTPIEHLSTPIYVSGDTAIYEDIDGQLWQIIYDEIEGYEALPDNAILPISRAQAEELITRMILELRQPYVEQAYRDSVVRAFKVETLKRRALDQALRRTYTDPYEERLDRMERIIYALLLSNGSVDPQVINNLLGGGQPAGTYVVPGQTYMPGQMVQGHQFTDNPQRAEIATPSTQSGQREVAPEEVIDLKPGLPIDSNKVDLYMSVAYFGFDSAEISAETRQTLDNVVGWLKENNMRVSLHGYSSLEGNIKYNNKLSGRRVSAVADYLVSKGITRSRLEVIPSGIDSMKEQKSSYPDARRVEIRPILY